MTTPTNPPRRRWRLEDAYDAEFAAAAREHGVPAALLKAIAGQESDFIASAANLSGGDGERGGSYGLMQMSLATARLMRPDITPALLYVPGVNTSLGARHLATLLRAAARNGYGFDSAISAYNAGNSRHRPGDGKRVGPIAQATPAQARRVPFINQDSYVGPVLVNLRHFGARGYSLDAPAYANREGKPGVLVLAALALLAPFLWSGR